jgi:hypothetical protein
MKNYNPFKMWGSYVGAFLFLIIGTVYFTPLFHNILANCHSILQDNGVTQTNCFYDPTEPLSVILGILMFIPGFLLGWGIHSLVRALR